MNPFMTTFAILAFVYLMIGCWAIAVWIPSSLAISFFGLVVCSVGWYFSKEYFS